MFTTKIHPRVSETDGLGHINNTTLPIWFEAGRDGIFKIFTPDLSFKRWRCVILKMEVEYLAQLYYGTPVYIKTWVAKIGNKSFELYEEIHQNNQCCARGKAVYVNYDVETSTSLSIPDEVRVELNRHTVSS
ncbi:acyl-CoA thioester hydrolase [Geomicrobium halophilum]|uniref:Acyl-CoA thioester hydrolase n=1 Tax=Geomicrobium halophilum TaxID=549000 RepID=A0A841PZK9_9BACL|nr:thioesterase family protein [Geomicrobium halophilum]MBB6450172.1 acyl-CoA thioester hydrolase [Geomicrobium halophilum]